MYTTKKRSTKTRRNLVENVQTLEFYAMNTFINKVLKCFFILYQVIFFMNTFFDPL